MPYIFKKQRHTCWTPLGLLVQDGAIWQCGKCKQYWLLSQAGPYRWTKVSARRAKQLIEEESNGRE